ncbi:hypothetical protein EON66_08145, partial [archaeon]
MKTVSLHSTVHIQNTLSIPILVQFEIPMPAAGSRILARCALPPGKGVHAPLEAAACGTFAVAPLLSEYAPYLQTLQREMHRASTEGSDDVNAHGERAAASGVSGSPTSPGGQRVAQHATAADAASPAEADDEGGEVAAPLRTRAIAKRALPIDVPLVELTPFQLSPAASLQRVQASGGIAELGFTGVPNLVPGCMNGLEADRVQRQRAIVEAQRQTGSRAFIRCESEVGADGMPLASREYLGTLPVHTPVFYCCAHVLAPAACSDLMLSASPTPPPWSARGQAGLVSARSAMCTITLLPCVRLENLLPLTVVCQVAVDAAYAGASAHVGGTHAHVAHETAAAGIAVERRAAALQPGETDQSDRLNVHGFTGKEVLPHAFLHTTLPPGAIRDVLFFPAARRVGTPGLQHAPPCLNAALSFLLERSVSASRRYAQLGWGGLQKMAHLYDPTPTSSVLCAPAFIFDAAVNDDASDAPHASIGRSPLYIPIERTFVGNTLMDASNEAAQSSVGEKPGTWRDGSEDGAATVQSDAQANAYAAHRALLLQDLAAASCLCRMFVPHWLVN